MVSFQGDYGKLLSEQQDDQSLRLCSYAKALGCDAYANRKVLNDGITVANPIHEFALSSYPERLTNVSRKPPLLTSLKAGTYRWMVCSNSHTVLPQRTQRRGPMPNNLRRIHITSNMDRIGKRAVHRG